MPFSERTYKKYLLSVLLVVLAFNQVDRFALGLVLQNLKVDLTLSDTQLGLLSGIAFALFYSVMGIPIARWADRGNRVTIISLTTALWSVAVALCGLAASFLQLLIIRIGVAVGEAGCIPTAHSLIGDYFTRAERPRAAGIYMLGWPLSMIIGYFLAGWLNELYGWRATFILLGLPGLALAGLARISLREPRCARTSAQPAQALPSHSSQDVNAGPSAVHPSLREVAATLWGNTSFRHLLLCFSLVLFFGYGMAQWQAAFFIRSYGLKTGALGTWFAAIYGVGGLLGTYWGGEFASRRLANKERLQLRATAVVYSTLSVVYVFVYLSPNQYVAFGLMALAAVGGTMTNGPLFATIQTLVPAHMRATSIAIIYLFANFIGMGLGPLAAGALSDFFRPMVAEESLRFALLALCPGFAWAAWHLWRASSTVVRDLEAHQIHAPT